MTLSSSQARAPRVILRLPDDFDYWTGEMELPVMKKKEPQRSHCNHDTDH